MLKRDKHFEQWQTDYRVVCFAVFWNPHKITHDDISIFRARRGGVKVAGWAVDRKIWVRFPAYPHRVWALWWQGGKRRLRTSCCPCRGRLGTLKTTSCPWRWVPGSRSKFGNWTTVPSLCCWNIAECNVKPQPTNQKIYLSVISKFNWTVLKILYIIIWSRYTYIDGMTWIESNINTHSIVKSRYHQSSNVRNQYLVLEIGNQHAKFEFKSPSFTFSVNEFAYKLTTKLIESWHTDNPN